MVAREARTIGHAWAAYEARAARTKTAAAAKVIWGYGPCIAPLFDRPIAGATLPVLNQWRDGLLIPTRTAVSANKIVRSLKAALAADGTAGPWSGLRQLDERSMPKDEALVLTAEQTRQLVAAAYVESHAFGDFVRAPAVTGARPAELRQCRVKDFRPGALQIPAGKTGARVLTLTRGTDAFVAAVAKGRAPDAPLLPRPDGRPWAEGDTRRPLARTLARPEAAGLPEAVTPYALQHAYITSAIYANLPLFAIARQTGTSAEMVERTYGHVLAETQAAVFGALDAALGF